MWFWLLFWGHISCPDFLCSGFIFSEFSRLIFRSGADCGCDGSFDSSCPRPWRLGVIFYPWLLGAIHEYYSAYVHPSAMCPAPSFTFTLSEPSYASASIPYREVHAYMLCSFLFGYPAVLILGFAAVWLGIWAAFTAAGTEQSWFFQPHAGLAPTDVWIAKLCLVWGYLLRGRVFSCYRRLPYTSMAWRSLRLFAVLACLDSNGCPAVPCSSSMLAQSVQLVLMP